MRRAHLTSLHFALILAAIIMFLTHLNGPLVSVIDLHPDMGTSVSIQVNWQLQQQ